MDDVTSWIGGVFMLTGFSVTVIALLMGSYGRKLRWGLLILGLGGFAAGIGVHLVHDGYLPVKTSVSVASNLR